MADVSNSPQDSDTTEKSNPVMRSRARFLSQKLGERKNQTSEDTFDTQTELVRKNRKRNRETNDQERGGDSDRLLQEDIRPTEKQPALEEEEKMQSGFGKKVHSAGKLIGKTGVASGFGKALEETGSILSMATNPFAAAQKKFGNSTIILMLIVALFFDVLIMIIDLLDFFLFGLASILFGSIIDFLALMTFVMWFKLRGAKFGKKRSFSLATGFIAKFIPFIDLIPDWTIAIIFSFLQENISVIAKAIPGGEAVKRAVGK